MTQKNPIAVAAVLSMFVVSLSTLGAGAQEKTPLERLSGGWQFNPAVSSPVPEMAGRGGGKDGNKWGGSGGTNSQSDGPTLPGAKDLMQLMDDLSAVPTRIALTATPDVINMIDDHGVSRRFTPNNKFEKVDYTVGKPSFRTHWDGTVLVQDINSDAIDLTRTFETTPDGAHMTMTLTIRRQPDPRLMAGQSNRGDVRRYVFDRVA